MTRSSALVSPPKKKQKQSSETEKPVIVKYPAVKTSGDTQQNLYATLSKRPVFLNKYVDSDATYRLNITKELTYKLAKVGWRGLLLMDEPSYSTLTYEFLSSFTVTTEGLLSFRIANTNHQITKAQLANMFDWELVEPQKLPADYATPFWLKITGLPSTTRYIAHDAYASDIISHCYRYFARLVSYTIYGRPESNNKIRSGELALLYYFDAKIPVDWTSLLIERLLYQAKKTTGALVIGGFVTRIAEKLGVFDRGTTSLKVVEGWSPRIDTEYVVCMKMLKTRPYDPIPHKRLAVAPLEEIELPALTLEQQVDELKKNQVQMIQTQERVEKQLSSMEKQLSDIAASIAKHFSHHAS